MIGWTEYRDQLEKNISNLSDTQKMSFAIDICDRLLPEYKAFQEKHNWGDYSVIINTFEYCKQNVKLVDIDFDMIDTYKSELDPIIPDTEDFNDILSSAALNCGVSLYETLDFMINRGIDQILNIAGYMYDTLDFKVQELIEEMNSNIEVESHDLIQSEIKRQLNKTS